MSEAFEEFLTLVCHECVNGAWVVLSFVTQNRTLYSRVNLIISNIHMQNKQSMQFANRCNMLLTFSQTLRHVPLAFVQHIDISEMKNDAIKHRYKNICLWTGADDNRGWTGQNSCCRTTIKWLWQLQMAVSHTVWSFWSIPSNDRLYSPCQRLYSRELVYATEQC